LYVIPQPNHNNHVCPLNEQQQQRTTTTNNSVWSLDDYHFLPFILGSSQQMRLVTDANYVVPSALRDVRKEDTTTADMFSQALQHIAVAKTGSLSQHSPILYDILSIESWAAINRGMLLLWKAEVLGKFPVAQHFVFGHVLKVTWDIVDQSEAQVKISPFNMAALQQSVVPGANPQATDIVSKFFARFGESGGARRRGGGGGGGGAAAAAAIGRGGRGPPTLGGLGLRTSSGLPQSSDKVDQPSETAASTAAAAGNVAHTMLENDAGIEICGWTIESNVSRIASDADWDAIVEANPWAVLPPPEQLFAMNYLRLKHAPSGKEIKFDPIEALRGVLLPPKPEATAAAAAATGEGVDQRAASAADRRLFKIVHAVHWGDRTDSEGNAIKQWRDDFDWTYTTLYQGTLAGGASRSRVAASDAGIDYNRLKRREPILWYKHIILSEDDLVDSGVSQVRTLDIIAFVCLVLVCLVVCLSSLAPCLFVCLFACLPC
jgi:hypothetical protein